MYRILNVLHYICVILTGMMTYIVIENPNDEEAMIFLILAIGLAISYRWGYLYVKKEKEESEDEYEDEEEGVMMSNNLTSSEIKKALEDKIEFKNFDENEYAVIDIEKLKNALDLINRYEAEVERLKKEKDEYAYLYDKHINTAFSHIKAEAYKEFAEKIKEKTKWLFSSVSINNEIDNLLNELVGDIKEKKKNNK